MFFHHFSIFVEKTLKSWKKKLVRIVIRFFFVSRGTISERNYFLEKITQFHHSDLEHTKKFNSMRRSFTNVASGSFYVFRGKFSGKQVVLEKHTNPHQFWSLKQNLIWTSQKNLNTMSTLTFTCRVGRSSRKKFTIVFETFWVFLNCCWSLTEKNWNFLRKRHGRVAKTAFYVSRGTIFWKTNCFFGKIVLFSSFDCQGEDYDSCKIF